MATIVATGTNGFIGTNVVEALLNACHLDVFGTTANKGRDAANSCNAIELAICSDLHSTTGRDQHTRLCNSGNTRYVPHTELSQFVRSLPEAPIALIHNGACSSTEETNQHVFDSLNLGYSKSMWELCSDLQIPFLYASSAGVYGSGEKGFSDKKEDCDLYEPLSMYAKSKHDFDLWALQQKQTPPSWFGLRYFNVYGPHEEHKGRQASMVLHLFKQISQTGKVRLYKSTTPDYEDGGQVRDFVYVKDIAKLSIDLIRLARERIESPQAHPIVGNGLFLNIGTGTPQSWNSLVREVFAALHMPPQIEYIDMPQSLAKQYQNYTCASLSSWSALGIALHPTPLAVGVSEYVKTNLIPFHSNQKI
jgi:ADP-L-glycero-D-manno-heptose 6-epimerase